MPSIVEKIANCEISQTQIDDNIRYKRIYLCFLEMKKERYKTITYHGKMLEGDVIQLEFIRKHFRKKLKEMKNVHMQERRPIQEIKSLRID